METSDESSTLANIMDEQTLDGLEFPEEVEEALREVNETSLFNFFNDSQFNFSLWHILVATLCYYPICYFKSFNCSNHL